MIFVYNYFKAPYVPKVLEPLSEFIKKYCCPIKPLYTAISSLNPAEIGMISSYFKFQAPPLE